MTLLNQLLKTGEQKLSPEILLIPQVVWSVDYEGLWSQALFS
jgi:hypothetical protein